MCVHVDAYNYVPTYAVNLILLPFLQTSLIDGKRIKQSVRNDSRPGGASVGRHGRVCGTLGIDTGLLSVLCT